MKISIESRTKAEDELTAWIDEQAEEVLALLYLVLFHLGWRINKAEEITRKAWKGKR